MGPGLPSGVWTKPSLQAEPGPVVPQGQCVTLVCQSPVDKAHFFRLEKEGDTYSEEDIPSGATEARFLIQAVSEASAGSYSCIYRRHSSWSPRSEALQLVVTADDVPPPRSGGSG